MQNQLYKLDLMSTRFITKSYYRFSMDFVLSADFNKQRSRKEINRLFIWTLLIALLLSGIRQVFRLRIDNEPTSGNPFSGIDGVNVVLTMILTITFYPLLYLGYSFVYRGTEKKDTNHVLYRVALLSQLAVIRDLLFIILTFTYYGNELFKNQELNSRDFVFTVLDVVLWLLTIIMMTPVIIARLNRPKSQDDTQLLAFVISLITFGLIWVFNFIVLRVFVELPFGGEMFT